MKYVIDCSTAFPAYVAERRGRIAPGDATRLLRNFLKQLPTLHPAWPDLLPRAHAIAAATVAGVYDCLYVALAEREECELVTADDKPIRNLQARFPFVIGLSTLP
jgi:predicted nucleic acid-binding protein